MFQTTNPTDAVYEKFHPSVELRPLLALGWCMTKVGPGAPWMDLRKYPYFDFNN